MGHDSFPCTANTAVVDFEGKPKPAAVALGEVFRSRKLGHGTVTRILKNTQVII